jgi:hypothetical protein
MYIFFSALQQTNGIQLSHCTFLQLPLNTHQLSSAGGENNPMLIFNATLRVAQNLRAGHQH